MRRTDKTEEVDVVYTEESTRVEKAKRKLKSVIHRHITCFLTKQEIMKEIDEIFEGLK